VVLLREALDLVCLALSRLAGCFRLSTAIASTLSLNWTTFVVSGLTCGVFEEVSRKEVILKVLWNVENLESSAFFFFPA
jgi:hypothetical protein